MANNPNAVHMGIVFPKETVTEIDARRGKYMSRNKYLQKIVEEYFNENETNDNQNGVWGSQVTSQQSHLATPTPTTSTEARKTNMPLYNGGFRA